MSRDPICYKDGAYLRMSQMRIAPNDLGILRGFGIFDFLRTYYGKPFLMDEHIARFMRSAKRMGLSAPSASALQRITQALITKNQFQDTNIKFILTGGESEDGVTLPSKPTFYALATEAHNPPKRYYTEGVHLKTHEYMRLVPDVKTLNYIESVRHQRELKGAGVLELLFVYEGRVLECSSSNVFVVKNGVLMTPKTNVLIGTTRDFILNLTKREYKSIERDVSVKELFASDEVFITASNKGVVPVVRIDGKKIGSGKPGPVTNTLMEKYDLYLRTR